MDESFVIGALCAIATVIMLLAVGTSISESSAKSQCESSFQTECEYVPSTYKPKGTN